MGINHWRLFNAESFLYIYVKYIWFGLVGFNGILIVVSYLILNPLHTYIGEKDFLVLKSVVKNSWTAEFPGCRCEIKVVASDCLELGGSYQWKYAQSVGAVEYTDCITAEGKDPPSKRCPWYDTKQSDGEAPVMLEYWRIWSTPSLPSFPGPL